MQTLKQNINLIINLEKTTKINFLKLINHNIFEYNDTNFIIKIAKYYNIKLGYLLNNNLELIREIVINKQLERKVYQLEIEKHKLERENDKMNKKVKENYQKKYFLLN